MKARLKAMATALGKMLGLLGLLFVLYTLFKEYSLDELLYRLERFYPYLPALLAFNMFSHFSGIYAWHRVVLNYRQKPFSYLFSYYYFAKTEIAKYLPGNIFHLVGRQALASRIGLSQKQMAKISLFVTSSLLLSTLLAAFALALASGYFSAWHLLVIALSLTAALGIYLKTFPSLHLLEKLRIWLFQSLSILIQGLMLAWIVSLQTPLSWHLFLATAAVYILSWLVGFVTPGASGGVGVREGAFIALASFSGLALSKETVVFSVLLIRLVNIASDIVMYLSAMALQNHVERKESKENG